MKTLAIVAALLAVVLGSYYFVYQTDYALLGDVTLLKIASTDVLGNPLYGKSCPRSSYASDVMSLSSPDKAGAAFFKFHPIAGKEVQCPPIAVIVDRKTAEASIAQ